MADDQSNDEQASDDARTLEDISGVGTSKADALRDAGFESIEDIKEADQDDLADADGVGNALAARIKADVGDLEVTDETEAEIEDESAEEEALDEDVETELQPRGLTEKTPELSENEERLLNRRRRGNRSSNGRTTTRKADARILATTPRPAVQAAPRRQGQGPESRGWFPHAESRPGKHPSGFEEVYVENLGDLEGVDGDSEAVRIASAVGARKRERIEEEAEDQGVRVLNPTYEEVEVESDD